MSDCSKEFDLKEYLNQTELAKNDVRSYVNQSFQGHLNKKESEKQKCTENASLLNKISTIDTLSTPVRAVLNVIWTNYDLILTFISSLIYSYILFGAYLILPLISYEMMHWNLSAVSLIYGIEGIFYVLLQFGLSKFCTSDEANYKMCIICSLFQLVDLCIFIAMKEAKRNFTRDVILTM